MNTLIFQIISLFVLIVFNAIPVFAGDNICPVPPDPPELIYDPANPKSMDQGTTVDIRVIGGVEPLDWSSSHPDYTFGYDTTYERTNPLTYSATGCGPVTLTITDSRIDPFTGGYNPQRVSGTINASLVSQDGGDYTEPEWDPGNLTTMGRNDSVTLTVNNGFAPYTWEILNDRGNLTMTYHLWEGLSLDETIDNDGINILYSNGVACGAVEIKVTDSCGNYVVGQVGLPSHGFWSNNGADSGIFDTVIADDHPTGQNPGNCDVVSNNLTFQDYTIFPYRYHFWGSIGKSNYRCCVTDCSEPNNSSGIRCTVDGWPYSTWENSDISNHWLYEDVPLIQESYAMFGEKNKLSEHGLGLHNGCALRSPLYDNTCSAVYAGDPDLPCETCAGTEFTGYLRDNRESCEARWAKNPTGVHVYRWMCTTK
jgi:hypothetical protein